MGGPNVSFRTAPWIFVESGDAQDDLMLSYPLSNEMRAALGAEVT